MAALGAPTMIAQSGPKTAIKISNHYLWVQLYYSKNSFLGKANIKNRKGFRTCAWRAALWPASHKINGRRCAPPAKWLPKNRKVWFWCIYMTSLELILSKIPEKIQLLRPAAARYACGSRAKSFPPPQTPFHFLPACLGFALKFFERVDGGAENKIIFLQYLLLINIQEFFSIHLKLFLCLLYF